MNTATATLPQLTGHRLCDAGDADWHALRGQGIGASESAAVCGLDPYKDALALWYEKVIQRLHAEGADDRDIAGDLEISESFVRDTLDPPDAGDDAWFGTHVEPVIAAFFERQTGRKVLESPVGLFRHCELDWMRATPDAVIEPQGDRTEGGEWKSLDPHYARVLGVKKDADELPAEATGYHLQSQWQAEVCGFSVVHFGILIGRRLVPFEVKRDERIIKALKQRGQELWERVLNMDPPEPDFTHRAALALQKELYQQVNDTRIELAEPLAEIAYRQRELREAKKEIDAELNENSAKLLAAIGEHAAGVLPDGKELRRIAIAEKEITYTRKAHVQLRECNVPKKGAVILPAVEDDTPDFEERFRRVDFALRDAGFERYEAHAGSWYYIHSNSPHRVRVSDHDANEKTADWMARHGVLGVRVDKDNWEIVMDTIREEVCPV